MTEIYLVRHPESQMNADPSLVAGQSNHVPITERGVEQSRRFARAYSEHYPIPDVIYSSPAVRTQSLLKIYSEITGNTTPYQIDPNLLELNQGLSEGRPRIEVYTPEVIANIQKETFDFALPGGESLTQLADRMLEWMYRVGNEHPNSVVLAATHGLAKRAVIGRLLGWSHEETTITPLGPMDNVALSHFTVEGENITVNFWGRNIIEPVEIAESELY